MAKYACYFVDVADRFNGVESVNAATDADALTYAKQLLRRERHTRAIEVWHEAQLVGRIDREHSSREMI